MPESIGASCDFAHIHLCESKGNSVWQQPSADLRCVSQQGHLAGQLHGICVLYLLLKRTGDSETEFLDSSFQCRVPYSASFQLYNTAAAWVDEII